jgi:hypothetical protein
MATVLHFGNVAQFPKTLQYSAILMAAVISHIISFYLFNYV